MANNEKRHPVGCPVLLVFSYLALVVCDCGRQLLELRIDEAGLVERNQRAPVDALRQFVGSRLDLVRSELRDGVVETPKVAALVLAMRRVVPNELHLVHVAVSDDLGLGEIIEDSVPLFVLHSAFGEAGKQLGAVLESLDGTGHDIHKARNVQLVRMLLGQRELVRKSLAAVEADQPQDAHLERHAAGTVKRVVEGETQAQIVAHLGQLDQLVFEIVLDIDSRTFADDVSLSSEVAELVIRESGLDGFDERTVLNQCVAFGANAQHGFGVGAAVSHPAGRFTLGGEQRDGFDSIIEVASRRGEGGGFGQDVGFVHVGVGVKC